MKAINTTSYMRTFKEFKEEIKEHSFDKYCFKNLTEQDHAGWAEALYVAQDGCLTIEYMQTRLWRFHFNGVIGTGTNLDEAIKDHKAKYDEHLS